MIAAGTTLTLDVQGSTGQWIPRTVDEVRAIVLDALSLHFEVYDASFTRQTLLADPENLYYWNWPYVAVVTLQTREAYAESADVGSIVAHAFYTGAGTMPTVTTRGSGPQQLPSSTYTGLSSTTLLFGALALAAVVIAMPYLRR